MSCLTVCLPQMCSGMIQTKMPPMIRVSGFFMWTITVVSSGVSIEEMLSV